MRQIAAALGAVLVVWSAQLVGQSPTMTVHFIDVGQALSALIEFPCGAMLVDAGSDEQHPNALVNYLNSFFARRQDLNRTIDLVLITHQHIDHDASLRDVVEKFTVKRYVDNGKTTGSGMPNVKWLKNEVRLHHRDIKIREVFDSAITGLPNRIGLTDDTIDPFDCGGVDPKVHILSGSFKTNPGWSATDFKNPNNHSLVTRIDFGSSSALFTGDLQNAGIDTMLQFYSGASRKALDADLLQIGHHGAKNGTTADLVNAVSPSVAVIPVGKWTFGRGSSAMYTTFAYGHPTQKALDLLAAGMIAVRTPAVDEMAGSGARSFHHTTISKAIYATGWDGNVDVTADVTGKLTVRTH